MFHPVLAGSRRDVGVGVLSEAVGLARVGPKEQPPASYMLRCFHLLRPEVTCQAKRVTSEGAHAGKAPFTSLPTASIVTESDRGGSQPSCKR